MSEDDKIEQLKNLLANDPGASEFVDLARMLAVAPEQRVEAREICFRGLTASPDNHRGRLELARLFYLDGYISFSVAQLEYLQTKVKIATLDRLISAFGSLQNKGDENVKTDMSQSGASDSSRNEILAELDLDAIVIEMYEDFATKAE